MKFVNYLLFQQRIRQIKKRSTTAIPLMLLTHSSQQPHINSFAFSSKDYLDWTGSVIRGDKKN